MLLVEVGDKAFKQAEHNCLEASKDMAMIRVQKASVASVESHEHCDWSCQSNQHVGVQDSSAYMGWADMLSVLSMTPMQDSPKSVSLTWPWLEISRLSGFRSRWMMACKHDTY
jgi:hypothetical protein